MIATCHTCNWESLTYAHKGWAEIVGETGIVW